MKTPVLIFVLLCSATLWAQSPTDVSQRSWLRGGGQSPSAVVEAEPRPPLAYAHVRENDILWEKRVWRVIDTHEKINLTFRHPQHSLWNAIESGVAEGTLTLYSPEDDRFGTLKAVNPAAPLDFLVTRDTLVIIDPVTLQETLQVVTNDFDPNRIKRWRVQEVWYFDQRYSQMKSRIIGIAPVVEIRTEMGEGVAYESALFWINYAEARPWLAQHTAINPGNDHDPMSWEDVLEMRRFHSYVYKESNIHDRRLQDYLTGDDLLRKSTQIDRDIQHKEMDMWSY
ncbi:MAG: gliding motility protein GldN [Bacteroidota bacterium]